LQLDLTSLAARAQLRHVQGSGRISVDLPPGAMVQVPADELAELQRRAGAPPALLSTPQAAEHFGYSAKWWRMRCQSGDVVGAFSEGKGPRVTWRIPCESAERFIAAYIHKRNTGGLRGPQNRGAPTRPHTP